jgi:hypothetical protein
VNGGFEHDTAYDVMSWAHETRTFSGREVVCIHDGRGSTSNTRVAGVGRVYTKENNDHTRYASIISWPFRAFSCVYKPLRLPHTMLPSITSKNSGNMKDHATITMVASFRCLKPVSRCCMSSVPFSKETPKTTMFWRLVASRMYGFEDVCLYLYLRQLKRQGDNLLCFCVV